MGKLAGIFNWITLKTGVRPNTYSIFVWMRQVNDRLLRLENKEVQGYIAERAEHEAQMGALIDRLESKIDILEERVKLLEQSDV